jgi:hypothetical protein
VVLVRRYFLRERGREAVIMGVWRITGDKAVALQVGEAALFEKDVCFVEEQDWSNCAN